jgi:hypothetical protein
MCYIPLIQILLIYYAMADRNATDECTSLFKVCDIVAEPWLLINMLYKFAFLCHLIYLCTYSLEQSPA